MRDVCQEGLYHKIALVNLDSRMSLYQSRLQPGGELADLHPYRPEPHPADLCATVGGKLRYAAPCCSLLPKEAEPESNELPANPEITPSVTCGQPRPAALLPDCSVSQHEHFMYAPQGGDTFRGAGHARGSWHPAASDHKSRRSDPDTHAMCLKQLD